MDENTLFAFDNERILDQYIVNKPPDGTEGKGVPSGGMRGKGAYGFVFVAVDSMNPDLNVAIKFIPQDKLREAWLSDIQEKVIPRAAPEENYNLVKVLRHGEVDTPHKGYAFVMPLASKSLDDCLKDASGNGLESELLVEWILGAAKGLEQLTNINLIHGDVTPTNILVFGETAKLSDFGYTREEITPSDWGIDTQSVAEWKQPTVANPNWLAPPEFRDRKYWDARSDQFSLAATYLYLRKGGYPLIDQDGKPDLKSVTSEEKVVLEKALNTNAWDRYVTSRKFADALYAAVRVHAQRESIPEIAEDQVVQNVGDTVSWVEPGPPKPEVVVQRGLNPYSWLWGEVKRLSPYLVTVAFAVVVFLIALQLHSHQKALDTLSSGAAQAENNHESTKQRVNSLDDQFSTLRVGLDYPKLFKGALAAYRQKDYETAVLLLKACPEEERQFEYHLLRRVVEEGKNARGERFDPSSHLNYRLDQFSENRDTSVVWAVAFGPKVESDGKLRDDVYVVWGTSSGSVYLRDSSNSDARKPLTDHNIDVKAVAFRPDGREVASVTAKGELRTCQLSPVIAVTVLPPTNVPLTFVEYDLAGHRIAYAGASNDLYFKLLYDTITPLVGAGVREWVILRILNPADASAAKPPARDKDGNFLTYAVAISRDWRRVACKDTNRYLLLIDLTTGERTKLQDVAVGVVPSGLSHLGPVAFSPEARRLAGRRATPRTTRRIIGWPSGILRGSVRS